jgi:hypothetical protein
MNTIAIMVATKGKRSLRGVHLEPPYDLKGVWKGRNLECHVKNLKLLSLLVIVSSSFFSCAKFCHVVKIFSLRKKSDSQGFLVAIFQKTHSCSSLL